MEPDIPHSDMWAITLSHGIVTNQIQLALALAIALLFLAACAQTPPPAPTPSISTAIPWAEEGTAGLAAHPDIATVVVGQVLERSGEELLPVPDSPNSVLYSYWRLRVDQYLVNPYPYPELNIRLTEKVIRPDGSTAPVLYPLPGLVPGGQAVFFLSRYSDSSDPTLTDDTFALPIGPLGQECQRLIKEGQVHTVRSGLLDGEPGWEPLEDFIARIIRVASEAGRTTGDHLPAP